MTKKICPKFKSYWDTLSVIMRMRLIIGEDEIEKMQRNVI